MPKIKQFLRVPLFTIDELRLAHLCALELWEGREFDTGKTAYLSDEELLHEFSLRFNAAKANPNTLVQIDEDLVRELIRVARLKALYRSSSKMNFANATNTIANDIVNSYNNWMANQAGLVAHAQTTQSILDLAAGFVDQPPNINSPKYFRVALASRVLFFAVPEMLFFNFSNGLNKAMNFQSQPQAAISIFNRELFDGLQRNDVLLSRCPMPNQTILSSKTWNDAKSNGWWKRRVLDIALLLHFNVAFARHDLVLMARSGNPVI